jgi:AraC-like DNA-binding protein
MVVEAELNKLGLHPTNVELGEVEIEAENLSPEKHTEVAEALQRAGFALLDDRKSRLIEGIKATVIQMVHHDSQPPREKYSEVISGALHHDYSGLSRLFSETEGITIEQYIIGQKIERVKELMTYDELSLSQIAWQLGYSSVAHLSAQFKKVTGMTPTAFKSLRSGGRKPLDEVGHSGKSEIL